MANITRRRPADAHHANLYVNIQRPKPERNYGAWLVIAAALAAFACIAIGWSTGV